MPPQYTHVLFVVNAYLLFFFMQSIFPAMDDPIAALVRRIDNYLDRTGMKATNFGKKARNNPSLVPRLRKGVASIATLRKVSEYLDSAEKTERRKARKIGDRNGRVRD